MSVLNSIIAAICFGPYILHAKGVEEMLESELHHLETSQYTNPFELFQKWHEEAKSGGVLLPDNANLATSDGCGRVSARTLLLRQLDSDGFVFITDIRSKKVFDVQQNSQSALTFVWAIPRAEGFIARQVRVEGRVTVQPMSEYKHLYTREPFYCKIRAVLCRQGELIQWDELNKKHERLLAEEGAQIASATAPEHYTALKLHPEMFDFYEATEKSIADRVVYRKSDAASLIPPAVYSGNFSNQSEAETDETYTFNNGLRIVLGNTTVSSEPSTNNWVQYHIAA